MPLVIATAMIGVAVFSLMKPEAGLSTAADKPSRRLETAGYVATLVLGVYATFRGRWTPLVRERCVEAGMWLVGCAYNFCWEHDSLRVAASLGWGRRWQDRTK
jgi:hypothetical protein